MEIKGENKKTYLAPAIRVREIDQLMALAGSTETLPVNTDPDASEDSPVQSKSGSLWSDDDE